jgi:hypothetical protein
MMTVWKFRLQGTNAGRIMMPKGARALHVAMQNGEPFLWALVDTSQTSQEERRFEVYGTGQPMADLDDTDSPYPFAREVRHIGTFMMHDGRLVFHVFERINSPEPRRPANAL